MKKNKLTLSVFILFSSLVSNAFILQESAVANTAMLIFLIIMALLALLVIVSGGLFSSDDLKVIEGIGPEIEKALKAAGVKSYANLAGTNKATIENILADPKFNYAQPDTWARQAKLARDGKWDELKKLKEELKAGLKV